MSFFSTIKAWFVNSGITDIVRAAAANILSVVGAVGMAVLEAEAARLVANYEGVELPGDTKKVRVRETLATLAREHGIPATKRILDKLIQDAVVALDPGKPE